MTAVKSENKMSWEEMNSSVSKKISVIFYVCLFCLPLQGEVRGNSMSFSHSQEM